MKAPSLAEAQRMLSEAEKNNPGPWIAHSKFVAQAAEIIAKHCPKLEAQVAYNLGYLHDIGRQEGVSDMRHILDGYHFLITQGFEDAAQISLTHSFPIKNIQAVAGEWDCSPEEFALIKQFLQRVKYTDYDRLIQLCDCLALPNGFCLIEKRLVDVSLRRGVNAYTIERWKGYLQLKNDFEAIIGSSIYALLPDVIENTFKVDLLQ